MQIRLLGPVGLWSDGHELDLGPTRQRSVLAVLLLSFEDPVPTDILIRRVWGDDPPPRARDVLYTYIARLRRRLGGLQLRRAASGYLVEVDPEAVDVWRFNRLVAASAHTADLEERLELLRGALALWRGEPLTGLSGCWLGRTRERLRRQRIGALVSRFDLELRLGRHASVVHELCGLVAAQPTVEPLVGHLMLALHRCGRTGEALEVYRETRQALVEEQGLQPGPALREVQRVILGEV